MKTRYFFRSQAWMVVTAVNTVTVNITVTVVTAATTMGAAMGKATHILYVRALPSSSGPTPLRCSNRLNFPVGW